MKTSKKNAVRIPKILTIAGSDSGGGAGLQADLKVITALGGYGMTVVTAITAQNTLGVTKIQGIDLDVIEAQIDAVVSDIGVDAVKIGMLASPEIVHCVATALRRHAIKIIVVDPVLRATSGASLGGDETAHAIREALFPLATVITPNMEEASILLGRPILEPDDFEQAAKDLIAMGPASVLIKGGHLNTKHTQLMDFLMWQAIDEDGKKILEQKKLLHYRINTPNTHGTGCSLSSAIANYLADGHDLSHAVAKGIAYVEAGLEAGTYLSIGEGSGPLWHMHAFYPTALPDDKESSTS
jgi:hydroxymethylpyrimidine/phosphomethylpyrimidine kinase